MQIHLHPEIFETVKRGTKNVEARVFDEKRQRLELGDALVFAVLIVVLLVKPTGLLGKKIHEKV